MNKFKAILVQKIPMYVSDRNISYFMSDGIFDFTIEADNEYKAEAKMLDYFYEHVWYNGSSDDDIPIEDFRNLTTNKKVSALEDMECTFEYIIYHNPEKTETTKITIK